MRRVALLLTATAFAATAVPADAYSKSVYVWPFDCTVTVEVNDVAFMANNRGLHVHRYGQNDINSTC